MTEDDTKVLQALASVYEDGGSEFSYAAFARLQRASGLERRAVRISCRRLTRKGLAVFGKGLCDEDGEFYGSGYSITLDGIEALKVAA